MKWYDFYKKYGIYIILITVFVFFSVMAPNFLSIDNLINVLRQVSMFGIVVIGVSFVMISGGADLSVGGQMAVGGMITGLLMVNFGVHPLLAALISMMVGVGFGVLNGVIAIKLKIMPLIVTLGTMLILQGIAFIITGGYPIYDLPKSFVVLGQGYVGPLPIPVIIFIAFIVFGWVVMNKTYFGRHLYAMGGNKEAARLAGINVERMTVIVYGFAGFVTSIASLIMLSRTNSAQPAAGNSYPFDCMTAACLGGVSILGGEGKISGAVVGVLIIGLLDNGLILMSVNSNYQSVIKGVVLIAAVGIDCVQKNTKKVKVATA